MFKILMLKMEIKIKTINYLSVQMISYQKSKKLFGQRLKIQKNIELNVLPVYDDTYIKTKIRTYGNKAFTNFRGLNVPEDDIECESFTVMSIGFLLVYENL